MSAQRTRLWRHRNFMKLWIGETVSVFGSQITLLALPLTAALTLQATPTQMGILTATQFLPFLLIGLFAGVWVDRMRRRPILILADIGRGLLLGLIPVAALLSVLRIELLFVVGFCVGVLTVFFDVAYQSFLPSVVGREELVEGNSKLEISRSIAEISGPGISGTLVSIISAPLTILIDALSFFGSAFFMLLIDVREEPARPATQSRNMRAEITEGLRVIFDNVLLRSIAACTTTYNFFYNVVMAILVLYLTRNLNLSPATIGLIFSAVGIGGLAGAFVAARASERWGLGPTIIGGVAVSAIGTALIPFATDSSLPAIALLMFSQFLANMGVVIYNINQISLRQAITPDRLLGRMNASMRFITWGAPPLGALLGGGLGQRYGLWPALVVGAVGQLSAVLWVLLSPLVVLRKHPTPVHEAS